MTGLVPPESIEKIVGGKRQPVSHLARAVSSEQQVYILHSQQCIDSGIDLRHCDYSVALDKGIDLRDWVVDVPVLAAVNDAGRLMTVREWAR